MRIDASTTHVFCMIRACMCTIWRDGAPCRGAVRLEHQVVSHTPGRGASAIGLAEAPRAVILPCRTKTLGVSWCLRRLG
eukprot:8285914-Pyramimonas_sp.AAC.1